MAKNSLENRVIVIAEIGVNHNGSLAEAKALITQAFDAGADYAKFQTFNALQLVTTDAPLASYQKNSFDGEQQVDLLATLELSERDFEELADFCSLVGIGFLTTAHDAESADFVFGLDLDFIKVASGDTTNYPFLKKVGLQSKPVLLSTGASLAEEVLQAIETIESSGLSRSKITALQCTTEYPAPLEEANLLAMVQMGEEWGVPIGYSDHTLGQDAAVAVVALGATVVEKHITLDKSMEGPDHSASLEPSEFERMVRSIRSVELALGSSEKGVTRSEEPNRDVIRKSIVASRRIEEGERFSENNLAVMRPGGGLSPMMWPGLIGERARRTYLPQQMIELP